MFEVGFLILLTFLSTTSCEDNYEEKLLIKPLEDGMVMAHFEFITTWDKDIRDINFGMFRLFCFDTLTNLLCSVLIH